MAFMLPDEFVEPDVDDREALRTSGTRQVNTINCRSAPITPACMGMSVGKDEDDELELLEEEEPLEEEELLEEVELELLELPELLELLELLVIPG